MNPVEINFWFADKTLADALLNSVPPAGVTVSKPPARELQAAASVEIYHQVYIQINLSAHVPLALIVTWLLKTLLVKSDHRIKKTARINDAEIPLNKHQISVLVKKQLAEIHAHKGLRKKNRKVKVKPKK